MARNGVDGNNTYTHIWNAVLDVFDGVRAYGVLDCLKYGTQIINRIGSTYHQWSLQVLDSFNR